MFNFRLKETNCGRLNLQKKKEMSNLFGQFGAGEVSQNRLQGTIAIFPTRFSKLMLKNYVIISAEYLILYDRQRSLDYSSVYVL